MANRQFLRRIKASAGRAILILASTAVLSACGGSNGGNGVTSTCTVRFSDGSTAPCEPGTIIHPIIPIPVATTNIILYQGHSTEGWGTNGLAEVKSRFEAAGYTVYVLEMPEVGTLHTVGPISKFLEPVYALLDEIGPSYMVGLSGGGWTTTVVTATDSRIIKGFSIAGDTPLEVWEGEPDWEQSNPPYDYRTMYEMAGDRLERIYIWNDPCCFDHIEGDVSYPYITDFTTMTHELSSWTTNYILSRLQS